MRLPNSLLICRMHQQHGLKNAGVLVSSSSCLDMGQLPFVQWIKQSPVGTLCPLPGCWVRPAQTVNFSYHTQGQYLALKAYAKMRCKADLLVGTAACSRIHTKKGRVENLVS